MYFGNYSVWWISSIRSHADVLEDYLSMTIDENGCLVSLPVLLDLFTPDIDRLPILRLVTEVSSISFISV